MYTIRPLLALLTLQRCLLLLLYQYVCIKDFHSICNFSRERILFLKFISTLKIRKNPWVLQTFEIKKQIAFSIYDHMPPATTWVGHGRCFSKRCNAFVRYPPYCAKRNTRAWRFYAGAGGHRPLQKSWLAPKLWLSPKIQPTLDTVWSLLILI